MAEYEIYTRTIAIKGREYNLRPLGGRFLPKLYKLMAAFGENKVEEGKEVSVLKFLTEENTALLHTLALETFKKSYPEDDENTIDEFVAQNLIPLLEGIMSVNMPQSEEVKTAKE